MGSTALLCLGLAAASGPNVQLSASAGVIQRVGQVPFGGPAPVDDPDGGMPPGDGEEPGPGAQFAWDTELDAVLRVGVEDRTYRYGLAYRPRLLLRALDLDRCGLDFLRVSDGEATGEPTFRCPAAEAAGVAAQQGDPYILNHELTLTGAHQLAPRWQFTHSVVGQTGNTDFAALLGTGVGGSPSALPRTSVLSVDALSTTAQLRGPLVGRNDFTIQAQFGLNAPDDGGALAGEDEPAGRGFRCLPEAGQNAQVGDLATTCSYGLRVGTIHPLTRYDTLVVGASYLGSGFDPGGFLHALSGTADVEHRFSEGITGAAGVGFSVGINVGGGTDALPTGRLRLTADLVNERLRRVSLSATVFADGQSDPIIQTFYLQTGATVALTGVWRDLTGQVSVGGFLLAPELRCPPRSVLPDAESCPEDAGFSDRLPEGQTLDTVLDSEVPDLSSLAVSADVGWAIDRQLSLTAGVQYSLRGPHLSRWDGRPSVDGMPGGDGVLRGENELFTAQVGLRVTYDSGPSEGD